MGNLDELSIPQFESTDNEDGQIVNVVDGLFAIARALDRFTEAITHEQVGDALRGLAKLRDGVSVYGELDLMLDFKDELFVHEVKDQK